MLILTVLVAVVAFAFQAPRALVFSGGASLHAAQKATILPSVSTVPDPSVRLMEAFLKGFGVDESRRSRVAQSVLASSRKYNLDPRLVASIIIVESRANPFAISGSDAIGIMQIHLPTWGHTADREGINLFRIEDNVDFGVRILKDYVRQSGLWDGVKRYKGWFAADPESEQSAQEYVAKVQHIYGFQPPAASTAELLQ